MDTRQSWFDRTDRAVTAWMARHGIFILRVSLGAVFVWFGAVKFVPGLSPADGIATRTMQVLTAGTIGPEVTRPVLAAWEVLIGVGLLTGVWLRVTLLLMGVQLLGAMSPLVLLPRETWKIVPVVLTIEGQYIVKDVVLLAAGLVIGATVRGGRAMDHRDGSQIFKSARNPK